VSRIKPIEEWIEEERKRRAESEIGEKIENMKEKMKNLDQELQKKVGGLEIQLTGTGGDINILKEKINELQKYNEEQRALFLDFNKKLSGSI
jgi:Skp family chaperone for outer membrane proteins